MNVKLLKQVNTCKICNSDDGDNIDCEENLDKVEADVIPDDFNSGYCIVGAQYPMFCRMGKQSLLCYGHKTKETNRKVDVE